MESPRRRSLAEYLARYYPFSVIAEPEGGFAIIYPDLQGCLTQVERVEEIGPMADEVRQLWIESAYEMGMEIPDPSYPEEYSGKFNLRLPRSLHRRLAEAAERDGVSLNQHVVTLLARRDAEATVEKRLAAMEDRLEEIQLRETNLDQTETDLLGTS